MQFSELTLHSFFTAPKLTDNCEKKDQSPPPGCPRKDAIPQSPEEAIAILDSIYQQLVTLRQAGFLQRGSRVDIALSDASTSVVDAADNIGNADCTQV